MYYALHVGGGGGVVKSRGDARGLMRVLATLPNCQAQRAFEDPFLHTLVSLLILNMGDEFSNESFCTVIFDEFFLAGLGRDNVIRHLLKLLWYMYPKLPSARLHSLLKALQPTSQHNEAVHTLYESLRDRVGSHSMEDQLAANGQMDTLNLDCPSSTLTGIPTPTSSTCPL